MFVLLPSPYTQTRDTLTMFSGENIALTLLSKVNFGFILKRKSDLYDMTSLSTEVVQSNIN